MTRLVADVFEAVLIDNLTGNTIGSTTLQSGAVEVSVQANDVRGGRGNQLIAVLTSDRDINVNLSDAAFQYDWLAVQLGTNITTGAGVAYTTPAWHTVSGANTITLSPAPIATNDMMRIFDNTGVEITRIGAAPTVNQYTIAGGVLTFNVARANTQVEIRTYRYTSAAATQTINIDNSRFPGGVTLILETLEINNNLTPTARIQWVFTNALPTGSFTVNTSSERTASAQDFSLRIVKPATSNIVGQVMRIPI